MFNPARILNTRLQRTLACAVAALTFWSAPATAQIIEKEVPADARGLDVVEKPGAMLPLDTPLIRADGKQVMLGDYFKSASGDAKPAVPVSGKPTILALVYYSCPVTCSAVMDKVIGCMNGLDYTAGTEFNTLFVSFDPDEKTPKARETKQMSLLAYQRPSTPTVNAGVEFFTAEASASKAIADAVGFRYRRLANGQYSHPVCIFVITPEGKVSRYFYGFDYPSRDMKLALLEAGEGKVSRSIGERVLMFCYMYDPAKGRYTLQALRVMQVGGVLTMLVVFGLVGAMLLVERVRRRAAPAAGAPLSTPPVVRVAADPSTVPVSTPSSATKTVRIVVKQGTLIPGKLA